MLAAVSCHKKEAVKGSLEELYARIDAEIERSGLYVENKERQIELLKNDLRNAHEDRYRFDIYDRLVEEYQAYVCDSAFKYVEDALVAARMLGDKHKENTYLIKQADIASHAGMFSEAHNILKTINRTELDSTQLEKYYWAHCALYQYESEYLPNGDYTSRAQKLRKQYTDSLLQFSHQTSFSYLTNEFISNLEEERYDKLVNELTARLAQYKEGTREYSILSSTLATLYRMKGNRNLEKRYLARTVISDIKGAVKENMAMRELATRVFEDGDIERANQYMKFSLDDANFFASRMTTIQSARMLPVIDKAYDDSQHKLQKRQRSFIYITGILLILAVIGLCVILGQIRHIKNANKKVRQSNEELTTMSERIQDANTALEKSNDELKRSNRTAQEYAGLFMEFCSLTISNLQKYHLALRHLALQGNVKGILKKLDKSDATSDTLKAFYQKFDEAILNLYPNFIEHVNSLLAPDSQLILKNDEKLNTELRILALIKIGIIDSEKISEFLRCSLSTVYTYRSRLKRRALDPDKFEQLIKEM